MLLKRLGYKTSIALEKLWKISGLYLQNLGRFSLRLYYSLPVHLIRSQIVRHPSVVLFWVILILLVRGDIAQGIGGPYLFWEPEYLGKSDFKSFFFIGLALGIYTVSYHLSTYILDGYRFFFLIFQKRPFLRFSLNNSLLPLIFLWCYFDAYYRFAIHNPQLSITTFFSNFLSLLAGFFLFVSLAVLYFSRTNQDIIQLFGERVVRELQSPRALLYKARSIQRMQDYVTYYLDTDFRIRAAPLNVQAETRMILRVLNQNHGNALLFELFVVLLLTFLGVFQEVPWVRLPAAASFIILFTFIIMLIGALSFWFRRMGILALILLGFLLVWINRSSWFNRPHQLFGLRYDIQIPYTLDSIHQHIDSLSLQEAYEVGRTLLNHWKAKHKEEKPLAILLNVSGGGLRSALWTFRVLQYLDSLTNGRFFDHVVCITGASGGMLGAAYYRERCLKDPKKTFLYSKEPFQRISADLLNSVIFSAVVNFLLPPYRYFSIHGKQYYKDRGYTFEKTLCKHLDIPFERPLSYYRPLELQAKIPLMIFSPTITVDGRQLLMASLPVDYLVVPRKFNDAYINEISAVSFQRYFKSCGADSVLFSSVLRANASFPLVLPYIELPTIPYVTIMDAGIRDNFGVHLSIKFLHAFKDWFEQNTSGVLILQIRDSQREAAIAEKEKSVLAHIKELIGGTFLSFREGKDFITDELFRYAASWYRGLFQVVEFQYLPSPQFERAALNFHLTSWEKQDILLSIYNKPNRKAVETVLKMIEETRN